ncbi:MAG: hypothetical protein HY062_12455 [Bacteroidetes bacterium]|nr:hypothetical protein [Bacteroidota bacterium]
MRVNNENLDFFDNESKEELFRLLLNVNFPRITKLSKKVLIEVLVNGKKIEDLKQPFKLPKTRLKSIYSEGIKSLKLSLVELNLRLESVDKLEHELKVTKADLRELEEYVKIEKNLPPALLEILSIKITDTDLSSRVKNICNNIGIYSLREVVRYSKNDFSKLRNCGNLSVKELEAYLKKLGLSWSMDV